jgi:23S rRNA pseudouridine2605 synthase
LEKVEEQNSKDNQENFRLNKFLSQSGVASRRASDELIAQGRVQVNGEVVRELGVRVDPRKDKVTVDGQLVRLPETHTYILLNKPKDTITTVKDEQGRHTVMDLIPSSGRLYPVGRLDRNSTGVLLLTNDGELAHRLMHPKFTVEKAYFVRLDKPLQENDRKKLLRGVRIDRRPARAEKITFIEHSKRTEVGVVLHEGRNRQIRKMFETLQYKVKALDRVTYGGLTCQNLNRGAWRYLSKKEVLSLKSLVKLQQK